MKVGPNGKKAIEACVKQHLDMEKSGVPRERCEKMLARWVVALLENQTETLQKELEA